MHAISWIIRSMKAKLTKLHMNQFVASRRSIWSSTPFIIGKYERIEYITMNPYTYRICDHIVWFYTNSWSSWQWEPVLRTRCRSPNSGSAIVKSIFFGSLRSESPAMGLCRRMWPPRACPIANSTPQMEHRCTLRLDVERSTLGRLWLVRWPPRAWNVGNWRLHVLHSNTPSAALTFLRTVAGLSPQESDSNSNSSAPAACCSSSSSLERFIQGLDALNSFRDTNCCTGWEAPRCWFIRADSAIAYRPRIHVKCRDCLRFQHAVDKQSVRLRRSGFQIAAAAKVPSVSCLICSELYVRLWLGMDGRRVTYSLRGLRIRCFDSSSFAAKLHDRPRTPTAFKGRSHLLQVGSQTTSLLIDLAVLIR